MCICNRCVQGCVCMCVYTRMCMSPPVHQSISRPVDCLNSNSSGTTNLVILIKVSHWPKTPPSTGLAKELRGLPVSPDC